MSAPATASGRLPEHVMTARPAVEQQQRDSPVVAGLAADTQRLRTNLHNLDREYEGTSHLQ